MQNTEFLSLNAPEFTDKADVSKLSDNMYRIDDNIKSLNEFDASVEQRLTKLELKGEGESVSIVSFTASPNVCELGSTTNVVLNWLIEGDVAEVKINGVVTAGNSKIIPNVVTTSKYMISVKGINGSVDTRTVEVVFANQIFCGTNKSKTIDRNLVKNLQSKALSEDINCDVTLKPNQEYVYYAFPKRLGTATIAPLDGGFEEPVTVLIDNKSGFSEEYYVYRSTQILNGKARFKFRKG